VVRGFGVQKDGFEARLGWGHAKSKQEQAQVLVKLMASRSLTWVGAGAIVVFRYDVQSVTRGKTFDFSGAQLGFDLLDHAPHSDCQAKVRAHEGQHQDNQHQE